LRGDRCTSMILAHSNSPTALAGLWAALRYRPDARSQQEVGKRASKQSAEQEANIKHRQAGR
jgi:hypothetical protein